MRNLASIQKIVKLEPIEGKDRIELATILGWEVIVEKGKYQVGDLVVYCEIDSILPVREEFEFLRSRCYSSKWDGFRIKTLKVGITISQGIVFPLSILNSTIQKKAKEGLDVTEVLKITKYDPEPDDVSRKKKRNKFMTWLFTFAITRFIWRIFVPTKEKGAWPNYIIKTDETRIQALPHILGQYQDVKVYVTEKMEGQSGSFTLDKKGNPVVCSRNIWKKTDDGSNWWKVWHAYNLKSALETVKKKLGLDVVLQGEICGPGIQGNIYKFSALKLFLFSAIDKATEKYVDFDTFINILNCVGPLGVPMLKLNCSLSEIGTDVQGLVEFAKGQSTFGDTKREGVVIRSMTGKPYNVKGLGSHFSFKVINPEYLLSNEK